MLVEIRPGEGGKDAEDFAAQLETMLLTIVRSADYTAVVTDRETHRISSFETDGPVGVLTKLAGTHRVQRIPKGAGARHTSTATIAVLDVDATKH